MPEHQRHGGIDVDGDAVGPLRPKKTQTMVGDDGFERFELVGTEATKVIVERIDARHSAGGEVLEQRVSREPFEVEYPPRSDHCGVEQQLHLGVHGVDHLLARLDVTEVARRTFRVPSAFEVFVIANEATSALGPKFLLVSLFRNQASLSPLRGWSEIEAYTVDREQPMEVASALVVVVRM